MTANTIPTVIVAGGYSPKTVRLKAGTAARISFDRQEASGCSAELLIPAFGVHEKLPAFQTTVVEIAPQVPGEYEFTCGMNMLRGSIIVEA